MRYFVLLSLLSDVHTSKNKSYCVSELCPERLNISSPSEPFVAAWWEMLEGSGIKGLFPSSGHPECFGISPHFLCFSLPSEHKGHGAKLLEVPGDLAEMCVMGCCSLVLLQGVHVQHNCSSKTSSCSYLSASKHCFSLHETSLRQMVPVNILSSESLDYLLSNFILMLSNWIRSIFFCFFFFLFEAKLSHIIKPYLEFWFYFGVENNFFWKETI